MAARYRHRLPELCAVSAYDGVPENIAFPLQQRRRAAGRDRRAGSSDAGAGQTREIGDRRPAQLSGGQQQRVALARALVFDPPLVLMDEPLGALDKRLREHMQVELKRIHARVGVTIVYVTHDQGEALAMSDRIAVFADGRIRQLASPSRTLRAPCKRARCGLCRREQSHSRRSRRGDRRDVQDPHIERTGHSRRGRGRARERPQGSIGAPSRAGRNQRRTRRELL